ncbi:MAG: capsular polysaccharide biosynthesis protein, partial [Paracoccaceae bacterium]|nr:capsular polysaccharide biosynthesis protein [Paracoccaceae bacterium]
MAQIDLTDAAGGETSRRLFCYAGGLLRPGRVRRILTLAGLTPSLGLPGPDDLVGVWGRSPIAGRGETIAARRKVGLVRIEDAFLRSVRPGRMGDPPLGLMIDRSGGVHFDAGTPSALERLLASHPLDDTALLDRARDGIGRLIAGDLSKYNLHDPALPAPEPGYVLVIDQTRGDASIAHGGASGATFREMLVFAQEEHPGARILIRSHPETAAGLRPGHYGPQDATGNVRLLTEPVSPWRLLQGAVAVYTVSSQLGFEAILAGHRPRVFGQPFYAGWGLTSDEAPVPRRRRALTRAQLFAGAMILAPTWYDPCRDRLCRFEEAVDQLEAEVRAYREDRAGHVALGMRLWKRRPIQSVFGRYKAVRFIDRPEQALAAAQRDGRGILVWAGKEPPDLTAVAWDGLGQQNGIAHMPPPGMDQTVPVATAKGRPAAPD